MKINRQLKKCYYCIIILIISSFSKLASAVPTAPGLPVEYKIDIVIKWGSSEIGTASIGWTTVNATLHVDVPSGATVYAVADSRDTDNVYDGGWAAIDQSPNLTNEWNIDFDDTYEIAGKSIGQNGLYIDPWWSGGTGLKNIMFRVKDDCTAYIEKPNGIVGTVELHVIRATLQLTGVNYETIQNIPINARVPTSMDGPVLGHGQPYETAKVRGKVTIAGWPNVEYTVLIEDSCSGTGRIDVPYSVSVTTDYTGAGTNEFTITGTAKSSELNDIEIAASISYVIHTLTDDDQDITVYEIKWEKGDVVSADTDCDTSRLNDPKQDPQATSYYFYLTIPSVSIWPDKTVEGKWTPHDSIRGAQSIACRPSNPNTIGGGMISVINYQDHDDRWINAINYAEDCKIDCITIPANAYNGKIKCYPIVSAIVRYYVDVEAWDDRTPSPITFSFSIPYVGSVSFAAVSALPDYGAVGVVMAGLSVKFPGSTVDYRQREFHLDTGASADPQPLDDSEPLEVSPTVFKILQVGSDPTMCGVSLKTQAWDQHYGNVPEAYRSQAEARFYGFKTSDTSITLGDSIELYQ